MDPFFPDRGLTTMETFIPSPNLNNNRSKMLRPKINRIFSQLVETWNPQLKNYAFIRALKGDVFTNCGDYVCLSVLEVCEELRKYDPHLFDKKSPRKIAEEILDGLRNRDFNLVKINGEMINMINQGSIRVHDAGIITFQLDGSRIAHRIDEMLTNGPNMWAPTLYTKRKARAIFVSYTTIEGVTGLRADCMKHALANIFMYSGIDVLVSKSTHVDVDLETIRYGVCKYKADVLVYLMPHLLREFIEKGFADARSQEWFRADVTLACCGYRSSSSDQGRLDWLQFFGQNEFKSLFGMAQDSGYTPDEFLGCLLKYTLLKRYRLAEVTFSLEEMIDREGNTLVNILRTEAWISEIIKNLTSRRKLSKSKKTLAGKGERELGLQLVQFTWVIEKACKSLMPHVVCEYMFDLSKLFMSYCPELDKVNLHLCKATQVVIRQCLQLLGVNSWRNSSLSPYIPHRVEPYILPHRVEEISAYHHRFSQSRFELFTMRVFVAHSDFDHGRIFGNIWVRDTYLARQDGWTKVDIKDRCYVSYFKHEWHKPLDIQYGSLIPFGDPSCRRSVPISSSLEVYVLLHAMSEDAQHCYLVFHGKNVEPISKKNLDQQPEVCPETQCGTLELQSEVGSVQINYILLKSAVDASMELLFGSSNPKSCVKIRGYITAYYGGNVIKDDDILGRYKAVIFRTTNFELTGKQGVLPLHKSLLAVPANGLLKIKAKLEDVDSGIEYVRETRDYRAGEDDNWCMKCGNFSIDLKVTWSR